MKILLITLSVLLSCLSFSQNMKSSHFSVCSNLSENEIIDKIRLDENGIGQLNYVDDANGGMKFKLLGIDKTVASVNRFKSIMPKSVKDMMALLESKAQFFEMTESTVISPIQKGDKSYAFLSVVIRPLPRHIRPKPNESHLKYYAKYVLKCSMQESPIKLNCRKVCKRQDNDQSKQCVDEKYPNFLMKEVDFSITAKEDSKCSGNLITVKHSTEIYQKDYVELLRFIIAQTTGFDLPDFVVKAIAKPKDMPDNMMDDYMINLYKNLTK